METESNKSPVGLWTFIGKSIVFGLLCLALNFLIGSFLKTYETEDLKESGILNDAFRWQDYYEINSNIDVLILGSSHANQTYDPRLLSKYLKGSPKVFNFGSPAQSPITSYGILEEVLRRHKPKLVVFDLYFMVFTSDNQMRNARFNWLAMKEGPGKKQFEKAVFSPRERLLLHFFPAFVYKDYLKPKLKKFLGLTYLRKKNKEYRYAGFVTDTTTVSREDLIYNNQFNFFEIKTEDYTEKNLIHIQKVLALCRQNKIEVINSIAPMPKVSIDRIENFQELSTQLEELVNDSTIPFYDFNRNRNSILIDSLHFSNDDHLNDKGSQIYSKYFAGIISDYFSDWMLSADQ